MIIQSRLDIGAFDRDWKDCQIEVSNGLVHPGDKWK